MARLSGPERRERIIQAAIRLFSEVGFHGSTTKALARKAGISEALLFRHFPDKNSLYEAILQNKMGEQLPFFLNDLPEHKGPEAVLRLIAHRVAGRNEEDHTFLRLLLFSSLENHALSKIFFRKRTLPIVDFLTEYFRKAVKGGLMRKVDPRATAFAFMAMVTGYVQTRIIFKIPEIVRKPAGEWLDLYVDAFLKGILP